MRFRFFTDLLTAVALLAAAVPGRKKKLWQCQRCGTWLGALDLEGGLVAVGSFGEEVEYWDDPYFGRVPMAVGVVLTEITIRDRHRVKCEACGVVNRRRRRG
jgi:hypothetical protein